MNSRDIKNETSTWNIFHMISMKVSPHLAHCARLCLRGTRGQGQSVRMAGKGISGTLGFAGVVSQRSGIESLQADPRFAALMRKIGFTEP
jgi:hypothetical protein